MSASVPLVEIYDLAAQTQLSPQGFDLALTLGRHKPSAMKAWALIDRRLLLFGVGLMCLGVIFGVAHTWTYLTELLGTLGKLFFMQVLIFTLMAYALYKGLDTHLGRLAVVAAIVFIGTLLALFGQTYQTGADTFTLFVTWAVVALPWVLASRNAGAWLVWILILQTALIAFIFEHMGFLGLMFGWMNPWQSAALLNAVLLVLWELAAQRWDYLRLSASWSARLAPRLIAFVLMGLLSIVTCVWIVVTKWAELGAELSSQNLGLGVALWCGTMLAGYWFYRRRQDTFMLGLGLFALLVVLLVALGRVIFAEGNFSAGVIGFPLLAAVVFFYTAWARRWLAGVVGSVAGGDSNKEIL